ncbi:MAG: nitronate monooxygenase [Antricoccus sp.]
MKSVLTNLLTPIVQAPMAGVCNPELAAAVCNAGGLGFLAAGYQSSDAMVEQIRRTRALTDRPFAVNLFVPQPDVTAYRAAHIARYAQRVATIASQYDVAPGAPVYDDDAFDDKIQRLIADPVPLVTFTFGAVEPTIVAHLQAAGTEVGFTVTSANEARQAQALSADLLVAQGADAGGHRGTWSLDAVPNDTETAALVTEVLAASELPVIAAGGVGEAADVARLLGLGCTAVAAGTIFLAADESTAPQVWKQAFTSGRFTNTVATRAFSGRIARALPNRFIDQLGQDAPAAYPQLHYLTRPIRAAAGRAGDPDGLALWAGTGFRHATARSAAQIVADLTPASSRTPTND